MNDHNSTGTDPNIEPGTEERIAAAMYVLAATHTPDPVPVHSAAGGSRRWLLGVAASVVLAIGVGALLLASNRETDSSADRLPQPDPTTGVTAATTPVDTGSVLPAVPTVYSPSPLGDDILPVVLPAPAQPIRGYQLGLTDWTNGIEGGTTFAVMDDGRIVGSVQVFDSPAPWEVISEGEDVIEIDGRKAVRVEGSDERGYFFQVEDGTRAVLDTSPPSQALGIDTDLADLLRLVGDQPLARFDDTERFVRIPIESAVGRSISYGTDDKLQLVQVRLEPDADDVAFRLVAELYRTFIEQTESGQLTETVQVSPVDLVMIIARNEEDLAAAVRDLQLAPLDESGVDFATYAAFAGEDVVARGEPSWGRWQVTANADAEAGTDEDCRLFQAFAWGVDGYGRGYTDCGPLGERNPVRTDGAQVYCVVLDVEIVGAVLHAATPPLVTIGGDIEGLTAESEDTGTSEFGASTTFRIVQAEPGANIRAADVLVDGEEITCA